MSLVNSKVRWEASRYIFYKIPFCNFIKNTGRDGEGCLGVGSYKLGKLHLTQKTTIISEIFTKIEVVL